MGKSKGSPFNPNYVGSPCATHGPKEGSVSKIDTYIDLAIKKV